MSEPREREREDRIAFAIRVLRERAHEPILADALAEVLARLARLEKEERRR